MTTTFFVALVCTAFLLALCSIANAGRRIAQALEDIAATPMSEPQPPPRAPDNSPITYKCAVPLCGQMHEPGSTYCEEHASEADDE